MTIRYYIHAWQGLLMFLAGIVSVLAAFAGFVQSGGGEELLRRALNQKTGTIQFDPPKFDWLGGKMEVTNLSRGGYTYGEGDAIARFDGLDAEKLTVKMDLYPWPPEIKSVTVRGMRKTAITVSEGFLQSWKLPRPDPETRYPPIAFDQCDVSLKIGNLKPLELQNCSGELRFGAGNEMRGAFSLRKLNGKDFNFKLESLEDGRWVFTGEDEIEIDTRGALAIGGNPFAALLKGQLDPVGLLVRALFTGEMAAEGKVTSLRVAVQPESSGRKFSCDGEVCYKDLEVRLPEPAQEAGRALPHFLGQLLGGGENFWPRWMQVNAIRTGPRGRVTFHMSEGRLNFACDEGSGSAFTGIRGSKAYRLEALKGEVETDAANRPRRILLRGFLGDELSFETQVDLPPDRSRTYVLLLEPRAQPPAAPVAQPGKGAVPAQPLWRFSSSVTDYLDAPKEETSQPMVAFKLESDARHFPWPEQLPPGLRDISGHIYVRGRFTKDFRLCLDTVSLNDRSSIIYGGELAEKPLSAAGDFSPLWQSLYSLFGTSTPWEMQNISLHGSAEVQFGSDLRWETTELKNFKLASGTIAHAGLIGDVGITGLTLSARHKRKAEASEIEVTALVPEKWSLKFGGDWRQEEGKAAAGTFRLVERDVPFVIHPLREWLSSAQVSADKRRVNRETTVRIGNGRVEVDVGP